MLKNSLSLFFYFIISISIAYSQERIIKQANYQCPSHFTIHNGETVIIEGNLIIKAPDYLTIETQGNLIVKGNVIIHGNRNYVHGNPHNFRKGTPANIINYGTAVIGGDVEIHDDANYEARGNSASLAVLGEYVNAYGSSSSHGFVHVSDQIHGQPGSHNFIGEKLQFNGLASRFFGGGMPGSQPPVRLTKENVDKVPDNLRGLITQNFPNSQIATTLPIELVSFTGDVYEDYIELNWVTATELNNSYFNLDKSTNGREYTTIAKIDGAGNSEQEIEYSYKDEDLSNGLIFYRLVQVDFDGKSESWNTTVNYHADSDKTQVISIYPDPADYNLNIIIHYKDEPNFEYRLIFVENGMVTELKPIHSIAHEKVMFDVSHLASGPYIIEILNHGKVLQKSEIIIQH